MFLQPCDRTKSEKTVAETAKRIVQFLKGKMNMKKHMDLNSFTSDHALYKKMNKCMKEEGFIDVELVWNVCTTHNAVNLCNATNAEFKENVKLKDTKSKFFCYLNK